MLREAPQARLQRIGQQPVGRLVQGACQAVLEQPAAQGADQQRAPGEAVGRRAGGGYGGQFFDQGQAGGVDVGQALEAFLQLGFVEQPQHQAGTFAKQRVQFVFGRFLVLCQRAPEQVVVGDALFAPARQQRIADAGGVHADDGLGHLGLEQQPLFQVVAVIAGQGIEQCFALQPQQVVGGAGIPGLVDGLDHGPVIAQVVLAHAFVDVGGVVFPAPLPRLADFSLLHLLLMLWVAERAHVAARHHHDLGVVLRVLGGRIGDAEGVLVLGVAVFGLLGQRLADILDGEGDGELALVVQAFGVGALHEGVQGFQAGIAPGVEFLGDAEGVVHHDGHPAMLRLVRRGHHFRAGSHHWDVRAIERLGLDQCLECALVLRREVGDQVEPLVGEDMGECLGWGLAGATGDVDGRQRIPVELQYAVLAQGVLGQRVGAVEQAQILDVVEVVDLEQPGHAPDGFQGIE